MKFRSRATPRTAVHYLRCAALLLVAFGSLGSLAAIGPVESYPRLWLLVFALIAVGVVNCVGVIWFGRAEARDKRSVAESRGRSGSQK